MRGGDQARQLALALPEAVEQDHHGFPSFRIRGKIFATLPDEQRLHVMIDPEVVEVTAEQDPDALEPLWWGKKVAGIRVWIDRAPAELVAELLEDAWRRRAPRTVLRAWDEQHDR